MCRWLFDVHYLQACDSDSAHAYLFDNNNLIKCAKMKVKAILINVSRRKKHISLCKIARKK